VSTWLADVIRPGHWSCEWARLVEHMIHVNPHAVLVAGENSFVRLSDHGSTTASHWASHWRVVWSPVGAGHVLLIDSPLVLGIRVLADNVELAAFLRREVECVLYPRFAHNAAEPTLASFERRGVPPRPVSEVTVAESLRIELCWGDFMEPFSFYADPGFRGGPLGLQTTFFSARRAELLVNGERADGAPWPDLRGTAPCTSACLAWCETWYRPRSAV
jgi:hypothetical protein